MSIKDIGKAALGLVAVPFIAIGAVIEEQKRRYEEEKRRREAICVFTDGISQERFLELVQEAARETVRVDSFDVDEMTVTIHVKSQSGLTTWDADIDYSDFGHLTGRYWLKTENDESLVPEHYAKVLRGKIEQDLSETVENLKQE